MKPLMWKLSQPGELGAVQEDGLVRREARLEHPEPPLEGRPIVLADTIAAGGGRRDGGRLGRPREGGSRRWSTVAGVEGPVHGGEAAASRRGERGLGRARIGGGEAAAWPPPSRFAAAGFLCAGGAGLRESASGHRTHTTRTSGEERRTSHELSGGISRRSKKPHFVHAIRSRGRRHSERRSHTRALRKMRTSSASRCPSFTLKSRMSSARSSGTPSCTGGRSPSARRRCRRRPSSSTGPGSPRRAGGSGSRCRSAARGARPR